MSNIPSDLPPILSQTTQKPMSTPSTHAATPAGKTLAVKVLEQLEQAGLKSWDALDRTANLLGVPSKTAALTSHVGQQVLTHGGDKKTEKSLNLVLEAIMEAKELTPRDLAFFLDAVQSNPESYTVKGRIVEKHLTALGLSDTEKLFWTKLFKRSENATNLAIYLPLLKDKSLFSPIDATLEQPLLKLSMALILMKNADGKSLINQIGDAKLFRLMPMGWNEIISGMKASPEMAQDVMPLLNKNSTGQDFAQAVASASRLSSNPSVQNTLILLLLSDKMNVNNSEVHQAIRNLPKADIEKTIGNLFANRDLLTSDVKNILFDPRKNYLQSPVSEEILASIRNTVTLPAGFPEDLRAQLTGKLFSGVMPAASVLAIDDLIATIPEELLVNTAKEGTRDQFILQMLNRNLPPGTQKKLLQLLPRERIQDLMTERMGNATPPIASEFETLFKDYLNKDVQLLLLENHLKSIGASAEAIQHWKTAFQNNQEKFPASLLLKMVALLPQLRDKNFFNNPKNDLTALIVEMMALQNSGGNFILEQELAGEWARNLAMMPLALKHPAYKKHAADYAAALERGVQLFSNSRIAAAWATIISRDSKGEFVNKWSRSELLRELTLDERKELALQMVTNLASWRQEVVALLNTSETVPGLSGPLLDAALAHAPFAQDKKVKFKAAILEASRNDENLPLRLAYFIPAMQASEWDKVRFDGSSDQLFISLLFPILIKKPPEGPSTMDKQRILSAMPKELALKFNTALLAHPEAASEVYKDLLRLSYISLHEDTSVRNSWEPFARAQLSKLRGRNANLSPLQNEMEAEWAKMSALTSVKKPAAWLNDLERDGWQPYQILGRTHIYQRNGKFLAVKWQKKEEEVGELFKELTTLNVIRNYQERLGLKSKYPTPVGIYQFEGALPAGLFDGSKVAVQATEPHANAVAYVYEFPDKSYFTYLHDPMETRDKVEVAKEFAFASHAFITDLFILAKNGLIMTQLADIFHRSEATRQERDDAGRFMAMNGLVRPSYESISEADQFSGIGSGRLHHIETAVQYVNARYSGLPDVGDSLLLSEITKPGFKFTETYFSDLIKKRPEDAITFILANFLAEYLLVYELTITERRVNQGNNALDWQDSTKLDELAKELKTGFSHAMQAYCGISQTLANKFLNHAAIDWVRAARQLHFFSRHDEKGHRPYNTAEKFPLEEIYGPNVKLGIEGYPNEKKGDPFWDEKIGMRNADDPKSRNRGTFSGTDPVKEPERARAATVTHMLLMQEAKKHAENARWKAGKLLAKPATDDEKRSNAREAVKLLHESNEFWPFDKRTYKLLEDAYAVLGDAHKALEARRQKAALILQAAWNKKLQK